MYARLLFFMLSAALFSGCAYNHQYYANTANVPLLAQKGEQRISAGLRSHQFYRSGDVQYARAHRQNLSLMGNGSWALGRADSLTSRHLFLEGAAGYSRFFPMKYNKPGAPEGWVAEVFGGAGMGWTRNHYSTQDFTFPPTPTGYVNGDSKAAYARLFVQPSIGYRNPVVEIALSARMGYLDFYRAEFSGSSNEAREDFRYLEWRSNFWLFEPAATLRLGFGPFKLQGQMMASNIPGELGTNFHISGGLLYTLSNKPESTKKKKRK